MTLKAPFPYFGGKRKVAGDVWARLGAVDNYIEPFAGSLAVLLGRPKRTYPRGCMTETVNDVDALLANFWRALASDPESVAKYADWPVNEADLTARHIWIVNRKADLYSRVMADPDYYCAKTAGWWVWGISSWIGIGWCAGDGPWTNIDGKLSKGAGEGVNRQLPHLGNAGMGVNTAIDLYAYMFALADRLRHVRVCCGDWKRVCTDGAMDFGNTVGVFLDPPYSSTDRETVYNHDTMGLAEEITAFCLQYGDNPRYRIALCGYDGEYDLPGWDRHTWTANRSYGNSKSETRNSENRGKETIWFSPHCLKPERQIGLFEAVAG